jgi:hypothetical protein
MSAGILLLLLVLLLGIGLVMLIRSTRRGRTQLTGPVCGSCGYRVVGLANMTCPECGSDLRRVGILTASTPSNTARAVFGSIVFTLVVCFVGLCVSAAIAAVLPVEHSDSEQVQLKTPDSGAYQGVILSSAGASFIGKPSGLPVRIDLTSNLGGGSAATSWLLARPDGGYEYVAAGLPRVVRPDGFGSAAVLEWMKAAGIDVNARSVAREAGRIAGETLLINRNTRRALAIDNQNGGGFTRSGGGEGAPFSTYVYTQRADGDSPHWPAVVVLLMWIALWAFGMRYLSRRWRPLPATSS